MSQSLSHVLFHPLTFYRKIYMFYSFCMSIIPYMSNFVNYL